jgi:hypothetical protein
LRLQLRRQSRSLVSTHWKRYAEWQFEGNVMNYQELPHPSIPGASLIRFEDGSTMTKPAGLSLMNSGATAQNMSMPEQNASYAPAPVVQDVQPQMNVPAGGMSMPQPNRSVGQPQTTAPLPPPAVPQQQFVPSAYDKLEADALSLYEYKPGSKGYGAEDAAKRFPVKMAQVQSRQGMKEFDPDAVRKYQQLEFEAARTSTLADVSLAESRAKVAMGVRQEQDAILQQQQLRQMQQEQDYQAKLGSLSDEAKQVADQQIKPDRIFDNMSTWGKLGLALAAGFGGAANPHGQNQIMNMVDNMIAQDVRAQEKSLMMKEGRVDNALGRLAAQWGSLQAGRTALTAMQYDAALKRGEAMVESLTSDAARARGESTLMALQAKQMQLFEQLRVESYGQTIQEDRNQYMDPKAAVAGGMRLKSVDKRLAQALGWGKVEKTQIGNTTGELKNIGIREGLMNPRRVPKPAELTTMRHLSDKLGELQALDSDYDRMFEKSGISVNDRGEAVLKNGEVPGIGPLTNRVGRVLGEDVAQRLANARDGADASEVRRVALDALMNKIKAQSGAAFKDSELDVQRHILGQGLAQGPQQFANALVAVRAQMKGRINTVKASAPSDVLDMWENNYKRLEARDKQMSGSKIRPYGGPHRESTTGDESLADAQRRERQDSGEDNTDYGDTNVDE